MKYSFLRFKFFIKFSIISFKSYKDYRKNGKWFSENCTDPNLLFEHVVAKPDQLIKSIKFSYFDKKETDKITKFQNTSQIWNLIDHDIYGRCMQITPTIEMIQFGIQRYELKFRYRPTVLFHSLGDFKTSRSPVTSVSPLSFSFSRIDLEYQVFDLLDIDGKPCNSGEYLVIVKKIQ